MKVLLLPNIIAILWGASELVVLMTMRAKPGSMLKDRRSLAAIWVVYPLTIWLAVFTAFAAQAWALHQSEVFRLLGLIIFLMGQSFRWYSIYYLGRYFTANVAISPDHRLIESGPYRFIRHPSYTGNFIAVIGFGLSLANMASLLVVMVPTFAVHLWRMRIEERALLEAFGDEYRNYMARTKRLVPFVY
jgi:protein-S-isoprenylcysteine O-methyltransferase Ste14